MFQSFYLSRRWLPWAFPGAALILLATWYKVELDVRINEWFGDFYNLIQKALGQLTHPLISLSVLGSKRIKRDAWAF